MPTSRDSRQFNAPDLARRLQAARKVKGFTQAQLAELTGLQRHNVKSYETGDSVPPLGTFVALAEALEVSLWWLAVGDEGGDDTVVERDVVVEIRLKSYIELVTDPDLLKKAAPTSQELLQLLIASKAGSIRDVVDLFGLLHEMRRETK
ncbi:helix-turn-helix domain-containing protein [bacterium]|nr:helix-turn-helix domain-containing protein [bacterium]